MAVPVDRFAAAPPDLKDQAARNIHGITFRYDAEAQRDGAPPGRRVGFPAQDLEKTPLGASAVRDTPEGKMVDRDQALGLALALIGRQSERIDALEAGKGGARKAMRDNLLSDRNRKDAVKAAGKPAVDAALDALAQGGPSAAAVQRAARSFSPEARDIENENMARIPVRSFARPEDRAKAEALDRTGKTLWASADRAAQAGDYAGAERLYQQSVAAYPAPSAERLLPQRLERLRSNALYDRIEGAPPQDRASDALYATLEAPPAPRVAAAPPAVVGSTSGAQVGAADQGPTVDFPEGMHRPLPWVPRPRYDAAVERGMQADAMAERAALGVPRDRAPVSLAERGMQADAAAEQAALASAPAYPPGFDPVRSDPSMPFPASVRRPLPFGRY